MVLILGKNKKKLLLEKEEIADLKEEMADYQEDVQELTEMSKADRLKLKETTGARRYALQIWVWLNKKVGKYQVIPIWSQTWLISQYFMQHFDPKWWPFTGAILKVSSTVVALFRIQYLKAINIKVLIIDLNKCTD